MSLIEASTLDGLLIKYEEDFVLCSKIEEVITTFIILFWLHYENNTVEKISSHVSYTLLYVIPTLPMFLAFPILINRFGFYWSIFLSVLITTFFVIVVHLLSKKYGYKII